MDIEYKFRAVIKNSDGRFQLFYFDLNECLIPGKIYQEIHFPTFDRIWDLNQYTRMKDSKNNKIFEGDILECKFKRSYREDYHCHGLYKAIFDRGSFKIEVIRYFIKPEFLPPRLLRIGSQRPSDNEFVVIGNIYSNKELLKD